MKLRHAFGLAGVLVLLMVAASCNQPQRRNDWRSPAPPVTGSTDAPAPPYGDAGAHPPGDPVHPALPNVKPSPNDIQL